MDPSKFHFDIEAYKRQSQIEEKYIVNRFRKRRDNIEENYAPHSKKKYFKRDHVALEVVNKEWNEYKQFKEQELERLDKITMTQEETNLLMKERTQAKKMKMFMKLSGEEHFDDQSKELLEKLNEDIFKN
ncbi:unnamed protein product [Arabidopsis lyrata]|uniref:Uncharacterized protein n=1 Tax=Arabidopsis lyrata subsp. lyrata TaxID=81972 RepID=D7LET7_ARALL|nr:hypothetical protein ARALYDRAFT_901474 [Arabidopsis lyrata subsp. lyrata]CAH8263760.1 unnamed protein product [Arabidopsis lyrata]